MGEKEETQKKKQKWEASVKKAEKKIPPRLGRFSTVSDLELPLLCTPEDLEKEDFNYLRDLGFPGSYPFTRGVQPNMYRGKLWTMRQFAGFGNAQQTNERFKLLLKEGQTGLSTAFDMPTLMGYDPGSPLAKGEVGKCGVSVATLEDMEELFSGIPLGEVSTSMTINGPAIILLMMYFAVAERQGVSKEKVRGTLQNDILKEYIAQKEWIIPIEPAVELVTDTIEYCTENFKNWNTVSISGYHIREAGSTAVQELAFTIADGLAYVDSSIKRGLSVDSFAPKLSFFFDVHSDFYEEVAKFRAARRMWAKLMKERYQAKDPRSWMLRTHAQTAGVSLTAQQPYNNIVRVAVQALAAIMGGTNSLHTNSMDETLALPTDEAVMIALRTQQVIAEESGVPHVIDPFGGSYFMEKLTNQVEREAMAYIQKIDEMGGMVKAVQNGFPQAEIAESAYRFQRQLESGDKVMVGANKYSVEEEKRTVETLYIDHTTEKEQIEKLNSIKNKRSSKAYQMAMKKIKEAAQAGQNMCPPILEAVKAHASLQEICDALRDVHGAYSEAGGF